MASMSKARFLISTAALATVVAILTLAIGPRLQLGDDQMLVIQGGTLIDSTGRMPIENATIIIRGDKIVRIETKPKGDWPKDVRVIDAHGKFIIPGLWDTHVHFGGSAGGFILPEEFSPEQFALNCRAYLYNGVTSVLDIGGAKDIILEWRKMEREGSIKAPRIFAVGPIFTAPGGHPAGTIYKGNDWLIEQATRQVADPESARQEVRKLISEDRVDAIKAVYEGGDGSLPKLPLDVLRAIIDEAHRLGKRVFVHVGGPQEAIDALNAGADGIEHMIGADEPGYEEALQLAARKGAFWTPTLVVDEAFAHAGDERYIRDYSTAGSVSALVLKSLRHPQSAWQAFAGQERRQRHYKQVLVSLEAARKANVRISLGTDAGNPAVFHGLSVHRELELMVKAGYSPMEALIAATRAAAEKLGVERELGTLEPGKTADLIILSSNPLEDIRNTRKIELVIKGGVVYKREELAIKPGEPKIAQQEPPAQMPIQPKPSSQPISIEQARRSFVQARKLFYNAANAEEFLRAREQLQTLEAGLKALIGSTPNDAEAFYWLGQVQYALAESFEVQADQGRARQYFEAAWDSAKRAVELDEKLSDAHRLIGDVIGRLIVYKGWQFAAANGLKAKAALERAIELDSKNAMAYLVLGHWYFFTPAMFGGDLKKALQAFAKALELADDEHEMFLAHIWLGQALMKQKELEKARDHFQRALAIYPNNRWAKALLDEMK